MLKEDKHTEFRTHFLRAFARRLSPAALAAAIIATTISLQGCAVLLVGAGAAGTVAYVRGNLRAAESASLEKVYAATHKALDQLELKVTEDKKDALSATVTARDAQDKRVLIKLKSISEQSTQINIRIGTFGDQTKSQLIYQKIRENLK